MRYFLDNSSIITHTLLSTHYSLLSTLYSLLSTLYSLLSTHYSLLTTPNALSHLHKAPTRCVRLHRGTVGCGSAFCAWCEG